jgi:hypothetical protein
VPGIYRPHHAERTVLYRVFFRHFERFVVAYQARFALALERLVFLEAEGSARGYDTLSVVIGRLSRESSVLNFPPRAKGNFLSLRLFSAKDLLADPIPHQRRVPVRSRSIVHN